MTAQNTNFNWLNWAWFWGKRCKPSICGVCQKELGSIIITALFKLFCGGMSKELAFKPTPTTLIGRLFPDTNRPGGMTFASAVNISKLTAAAAAAEIRLRHDNRHDASSRTAARYRGSARPRSIVARCHGNSRATAVAEPTTPGRAHGARPIWRSVDRRIITEHYRGFLGSRLHYTTPSSDVIAVPVKRYGRLCLPLKRNDTAGERDTGLRLGCILINETDHKER